MEDALYLSSQTRYAKPVIRVSVSRHDRAD